MKKLLLILSLCITGMYTQAQTSGGPDLYGNIWKDSFDPSGPVYSWVDISNYPEKVNVTGLADDNFVGPFYLPSPFAYYWYTVDRFWVGSNGYIAFGATQFSHPFPIIPTPNSTNNYLAPLMTDLNFVNTGTAGAGNPASCFYWVSPGADSVVITFDQVPFWTNATPQWTGDNTFQIILNYLDSTITFQYQTQSGTSLSTLDFVTVGIENNSGNDGLQWSHDIYPSSQYAIRFYPPANSTFAINDASTSYNDNPSSGARFISKNANGAFNLGAMIKNTGNTTLNPFNITGLVRASNNAIQVSNTFASDTLVPGQSQFINYINPFIPLNAGTYRFINTTTLAGDATPSNDGVTMELQVVDTTLIDIELKYDNGTAAANGISWNGGDGGCANYFIPPFYPCDITKVSAYIVTDPNAVGYYMIVQDDDGPNGAAGTVLDSVYVAAGTVISASFNITNLNQPVRIDSGGFYVAWVMAGDGVALGQNQVAPFSNRTFEILSGVMSDYRYREIEDLMIRATISRVGVGIDEPTVSQSFGQFYPNPASDRVSILIDAAGLNLNTLPVQIYDLSGKLISSRILSMENGTLEFSVGGLAPGIYTARFNAGNADVIRKFSIVR